MAEKSKVVEIAESVRPTLIAKNTYKQNSNEYNENNRNAISDGDEMGRGESQSGQVGTSIDIAKRNSLIAKNEYSAKNGYSVIE